MWWRTDAVKTAAQGAVLLAVALSMLALAAGGFSHDENQYLLGARLAQTHTVYKDFLYLQPPLHAVFFALLFDVFGDVGYFITARVATLLLGLASLIVFYGIALDLTRLRLEATVFTALLAMTPTFYAPVAVVRNDMMPLFFSLLSVLLILASCQYQRARKAMFFAAGLCAGIAFGTKLNYVHVALACAVFSLLWPAALPVKDRLSGQLVPLAAGGAVVAAVLAFYALPDLNAFLYIFEHHGVPPPGYISDRSGQFSIWRNLAVARSQLASDTVLAALLLVAISLCLFLWRGGDRQSFAPARGQWLIWLILLAGIPICLLPTPNHGWYYAPAIPFLFLAAASVWARMGLARTVPGKVLVVGIAAIACIPGFLKITRDQTARLLDRAYWTPLAVREASRRIDQILAEAGQEGRIATLSPGLLIDSKHAFYLQLSTGPFFFRRTPYLPEEKIKQLHGVSPSTLADVFAADMPAAIFGGHEEGLDQPLFEFAKAHGYRLVRDETVGGTLYIRSPSVAVERAP
jgi:hypothetical protein